MGKIVFFDLKDRPEIYIFEKKSGGGHVLKDTVPVAAKGPSAFTVERTLEAPGESYLSLPMALLSFRIMEFPFSGMERIREVLPLELDRLVLGGSEKVVCDAYVLGEHDGKYKTLVVYAMKDTLKTILQGLRHAGIDARFVTSIETASALASFASEEEVRKLVLGEGAGSLRTEDRVAIARKELQKPTVNLRRGELAYTGDAVKAGKSLKLAAALAFLLMFVFAADMSLKTVSAKKEIAAVKEENRRTYASVFPGEKKVSSELYQMKAHLKEIREKENIFTGIEPLQGLTAVASAGGQGTVFTEITLDRERVVMKGECPSLGDVQRLKASLEKSFSGVSISDTRASAQNRVGFTITAKGGKA